MTSSAINNKSQQINARFPHDVVSEMEFVLTDGESKAQFIITAVRMEIARRQTEGCADSALLSSLDALARIDEIGSKANDDIRALVDIARNEIQRRKK